MDRYYCVELSNGTVEIHDKQFYQGVTNGPSHWIITFLPRNGMPRKEDAEALCTALNDGTVVLFWRTV